MTIIVAECILNLFKEKFLSAKGAPFPNYVVLRKACGPRHRDSPRIGSRVTRSQPLKYRHVSKSYHRQKAFGAAVITTLCRSFSCNLFGSENKSRTDNRSHYNRLAKHGSSLLHSISHLTTNSS
ncbi:unnamed protein product [Rhodiola kirilowii]